MDNDYLGLQRHLDMMVVVRERWPEMVENPQIVAVPSGCTGLDIALYDPVPLTPDLPDRLLEERPLIKFEHIQLEPVGPYYPYYLGYGPISQTLAIRQEGPGDDI